ncbi:hypothetical protein SAMN05421839_1029 [Halolactibacillus halophilus]|uniref:Uncharacterized protein n=1 Tax=Halolactibacillus halophilus TaxID=306540 RepID=A0A1I5LEF7_9BACI|nr:hypothetical protein [Halolactibacillus halophilus]GEM00883.1 hypothetical protein HHA03_04150 [Halolactibacillus halophilus]SFO95101.1 hypothetical protein SAMN05421839_1029 [Halolactibacillus halophilus]
MNIKDEDFKKVMIKANEHFGVDPAYFGEEGYYFVQMQLIKMGYSLPKPYSDEDYNDAKKIGLDLDDWNDYKRYYKLEEYAAIT